MKVHFLGIGGIGVSALAQYYLAKGYQVSGSDLFSSEITKNLRRKGIKIFLGKNLVKKEADLIIYSPALRIKEILYPNLRAKILSYPEALGELTKKYFTIAVSGTHGKSTTTAMIGLLLIKAGLDPTVILGTKLKEFGNSNCRVGKSQYLVIEADEHFASFLNYWPKIIVLTNIEKDHLDYYQNLKNILKTYQKYISHLPKEGVMVANSDDKNISKLQARSSGAQFKIKNYSLTQKEAKKIKKILKVPGKHNLANALAALTVARILKIPDKISFRALSEYRGSWRRFEINRLKYKGKFLTLVSDYGHHPTEVEITLKAAKEKYSREKIWCIFQPHQYHRTYYLFKDFRKVFQKKLVDQIIITDIYDVPGREEKKIKKKINSEKLTKAINRNWVIYLPKNKIVNYLKKNLRGGEVIIIMGAGDIYHLTQLLARSKQLS